jgi:hypothetical protein
MRAEDVVYALLSGDAVVTAHTGTRIYPVILPQGVQVGAAAIVYELISATREPAIDAQAATHLTRSRVQVDIISPGIGVTRALRDAVMTALQFQRGVIAGITVHGVLHGGEGPVTFDEDLALFHRPVDFIVHHQQ